MSAAVHDATVKELVRAYFSSYPITSLTYAFDKIISYYDSQDLLKKNIRDQPGEMVKYLLALLLTTLAEHGQVEQSERYTGDAGKITAGVCNLDSFQTYCSRLGQPEDYVRYTHMILYLISVIRDEKTALVLEGSNAAVETYYADFQGTSPAFVSNVILMFYALLITRLTTFALNTQGIQHRYNIEACIFMITLSFYYDYVMYTKNFDKSCDSKHWELMLQQVKRRYFPAFFVILKLKFDLVAYLNQDNIVGFYGCVSKKFLQPFKKTLYAPLGQLKQPGLVTVDAAIGCLNNINLNSISMTYNRWFRYVVYNQFVKGIVAGAQAIPTAAGTVVDAARLGYSAYQYVYGDGWWSFPRLETGVTVGLIVFAGKLFHEASKKGLSLGWNGLTSAVVYVFSRKQLAPARPGFELGFEKPKAPAHLIWERSIDGTHSVIYSKSPLPTILVDVAKPPSTGYNWWQWGGAKPSQKKKSGKGHSKEMEELAKAMAKGVIKKTLPPEMQMYIKKKMKLNTNMEGGANGTGRRLLEEMLEDENREDPLPQGYVREIIDVAFEEAFFREEEDTMILVIPETPLQREATENTVFVDATEPALDKESPPVNLDHLPPPLKELDVSVPPTAHKPPLALPKDIPPLPVDPIATLPTITEATKERLINTSIHPSERDTVTIKRKVKRRRR